jgi:hypothetical protein
MAKRAYVQPHRKLALNTKPENVMEEARERGYVRRRYETEGPKVRR